MVYGGSCTEPGCSCGTFSPMSEYPTCSLCGHSPESHNGSPGGTGGGWETAPKPDENAWNVENKSQEQMYMPDNGQQQPYGSDVPSFPNSAGYSQSGYVQPGYAQPGYAQPGYAQPAYGQPGYYPPQQAPVYNVGAGAAGSDEEPVGMSTSLIAASFYVVWFFLPFIGCILSPIVILTNLSKSTPRQKVYFGHALVSMLFFGILWCINLFIFFVILPICWTIDITIYCVVLVISFGLMFWWFPFFITGIGTIIFVLFNIFMIVTGPIFTLTMVVLILVIQPKKTTCIASIGGICG